MAQLYKIQNKETGLFSTGGTLPGWNKNGKTWASRGALSGHLAQFSSLGIRTFYGDAQIVMVETVVVDTMEVDQYMAGIVERRAAREAERQAWIDNSNRERDMAQLEALASKLKLKVVPQ